MQFFIPKAQSSEDEQRIVAALTANIEHHMNAILSPRRVYSLNYKHEGKDRFATVGEIDPIQNEIILAIFFEPGRNVFHVCTPNRGLLAGPAILVGGNDVQKCIDFG